VILMIETNKHKFKNEIITKTPFISNK